MTPDLVDCPFCGSTEDVSCGRQGDYSFAICPTCGAQGPRVRFGSPRDKWSTRAAISAMPPPQEDTNEQHPGLSTCSVHRRILVRDASMPPNTWRCPACSAPSPDDAERKALGALHELQHQGGNLVAPRGGGSILAWAAEEIAASRKALASQSAAPQQEGVGEDDVQVIDLDKAFWDSLEKAAAESTWIPPEYYVNDWVSDCCEFLRNGHPSQSDASPPLVEPIFDENGKITNAPPSDPVDPAVIDREIARLKAALIEANSPPLVGVEGLRELSEKATPGPWAVNRHLGMVTGKGGAPVTGWASYELIVKAVNHVRSRVSGDAR